MIDYKVLEQSNSKISLVGFSSIKLEFYWGGKWNTYTNKTLLECIFELREEYPELISYREKS